MLLAVPNVSEGRDLVAVEAIAEAFQLGGARLLDLHTDADHHRSVFTLAGEPGSLAPALLRGAREAVLRLDVRAHTGEHPRVGIVDVVPIVHRIPEQRGAACAEALVAADLLGRELGLPVFLYGALAGGRTRAELRRGGPAELARRMESGELRPDFGPAELNATAGATLVAARPPLVAFNVVLAPGVSVEVARAVAALIREGGEEGLPGLRAIGLHLRTGDIVQVSTNVERPDEVPLAAVVEAVARHAPVAAAELVGLAPECALRGFPADLPLTGDDELQRHVLERALAVPGRSAPPTA